MPLQTETKNKILSCFTKFKDFKIMVFGDIILDVYIRGDVKRISPEAPVPVLNFKSEKFCLGGGGNVANNLSSLGVDVYLASILSEQINPHDKFAHNLISLIKDKGLNTQAVYHSNKRKTIAKTRVIAQSQQIVRVDREESHIIEDDLIDMLFEKINQLDVKLDGIIISDYGKGIVNQRTLSFIIDYAKKNNIFVSLDPKQNNFPLYKDIDIMTPNHFEASYDIGQPCESDEEVKQSGLKILEKHNLNELIITRGEKGMILFENRQAKSTGNGSPKITSLPAINQTLFDVSGAGDTVIALYTASYLSTKDPYLSAIIANVCAAIVVSKFGTSSVSLEEVIEFINKENFMNEKVI